MGLGTAYHEVLSHSHRQALKEAADELITTTLSDLAASDELDWTYDNWLLGTLLPPRHQLKYTGDFARKFFVCLVTAVWKLGQREKIGPSCVAEELAVHILLVEAEAIASNRGKDLDFDDFREAFFEDLDFEFLYDNAFDGIEEAKGGEDFGFAHLAYSEWFEQFGSPDESAYSQVHPYARDE